MEGYIVCKNLHLEILSTASIFKFHFGNRYLPIWVKLGVSHAIIVFSYIVILSSGRV